jgi:hypothetical protein
MMDDVVLTLVQGMIGHTQPLEKLRLILETSADLIPTCEVSAAVARGPAAAL